MKHPELPRRMVRCRDGQVRADLRSRFRFWRRRHLFIGITHFEASRRIQGACAHYRPDEKWRGRRFLQYRYGVCVRLRNQRVLIVAR